MDKKIVFRKKYVPQTVPGAKRVAYVHGRATGNNAFCTVCEILHEGHQKLVSYLGHLHVQARMNGNNTQQYRLFALL